MMKWLRDRAANSLPLALLILAGCGDSHAAVVREQTANFNEIAQTLREVKTEDDFAQAERKLLARAGHYRDVSRRARSLPRVDVPSEELQIEVPALQTAVKRMSTELARVRAIPGGPEFFERISASLGLPGGGDAPGADKK